MVKEKVKDAVTFLQQCLIETGLDVSKIIIFGSQSRDNAAEDSDIDIAIISKDFHNKDIFERARLTKDAEIKTIRKFMIPLDIVTLTSEEFENETSPVAEFAKSGKIMFAA